MATSEPESQMKRLAISTLIALGIMIVPAALGASRSAGAQESDGQLPHDTDIVPAARAKIAVSPPAEDHVDVPERFRGVHVVRDKEGKELEVDFTAAYRGGYVVGWRDFLARFQRGSLDLDEVQGDEVKEHIVPYQTIGGEPFFPGQLAGAAACSHALVALANNRKLIYLPRCPSGSSGSAPWVLANRG